MIITIVLLALCLGLSYYFLQEHRQRRLEHSDGCQPPRKLPQRGPFGVDEFLALGDAISNHTYFPTILSRFATVGSTTFTTRLPAATTTICSIEPANLQAVFATDAARWGVSWRQAGTADYVGRGFLTTDGAEWAHWRAAIEPGFARPNVGDHRDYARHLGLLIDRIPRDGSTVDLQELIALLYLDTSTLFIFGESFGSLSSGPDSGEAEAFLKSADQSLILGTIRSFLGPLKIFHRDPKYWSSMKTVHEIVDGYVNRAFLRREKQMATAAAAAAAEKTMTSDAATDAPGGDKERTKKKFHMLDAMVAQTSDRVAIRNNVMQGYLAAHDTTGFLIGNIFWLLARHPDMWAELRAQVFEKIGVDKELTFDDPQKIPLLHNIINETLRLYPVFPLHARVALVDTKLPTGGGPEGKSPVFVRAGTMFEGCFVALHRRRDVYGADTDVFRPDRWDELGERLKPWQFVPFGGGQRACLGRQKALAETGYFVCRMVREFESIEARDDREWTGKVLATATNAYGCLVGFKSAKC